MCAFVQMWITPDTLARNPGYEQLDMNTTLQSGGMHAVVAGQGHPGAIRIGQRDASLWVGRLHRGEPVVMATDTTSTSSPPPATSSETARTRALARWQRATPCASPTHPKSLPGS